MHHLLHLRYPRICGRGWRFVSGVLQLMLGGQGGGRVNIVGGEVISIVVVPVDATATYTLSSAGTESSNTGSINNTWLISGVASDYEVRATVNTGALTGGSATGAWLSLLSSRAWTCMRALDSSGLEQATLTIEVRDAATLAVLDTAAVSLYAEVSL